MNRPLLGPALLHVAGILVADVLPLSLLPLLCCGLGLSLHALAAPETGRWSLPVLIFITGAINMTLQREPISPHDLRSRGELPALITVRGTVASNPRVTESTRKGKTRLRTSVVLRVEGVQSPRGSWEAASGKLLAVVPGSPVIHRGHKLEVTGVLSLPDEARAPGLFDYRAYLKRKGIHCILSTRSTNQWTWLSPPGSPPWPARFQTWARATLGQGLPPDDPHIRLLWAMTLGWRTALNGEVSEPFMQSGTMHVFAISGLHIGLIVTILTALLRVLGLPRAACGLVLIPLLWFYAVATGWQPSAVRASVMSSVVIAGWALRRPGNLLNSLSAAALILLLLDPQQIFLPGFQLSFSVVLSIALVVPVLESWRQDWLRPDPLVLPRPKTRWRRTFEKAIQYLLTLATTSAAAWLGSLPLVAYHFNFFTPVSLLANLLVIPMGGLALMSSLGSLITGACLSDLSILFNHSAWLWIRLMTAVSATAANLPGAWFHVPPPSPLFFLLYYFTLIAVTRGWLKRRFRIGVVALITTLALSWLTQFHLDRETPSLSILPLSGGESVYVDLPGTKADCLIDCGNDQAAQYVTLPFLRSHGVNRLPRLILTHGDIRNVGGAEFIDSRLEIDRFSFGPTQFRSSAYRALHEKFRRTGQFEELQRGDLIGPWKVLHPDQADRFSLADDAALVLRGRFGKTTLLLISDLGRRGQAALMNREAVLQADILVAGLPRDTEPLSPRFLDAVKPGVMVVTDSHYPASQRASRSLERALYRRKIPVFYTRRTGGITLRFHKTRTRILPARGTPVELPGGSPSSVGASQLH